ncbi:MAG: hypothetical protein ACQKBT_08410, partial [Puniceicoccales bacterium]
HGGTYPPSESEKYPSNKENVRIITLLEEGYIPVISESHILCNPLNVKENVGVSSAGFFGTVGMP